MHVSVPFVNKWECPHIRMEKKYRGSQICAGTGDGRDSCDGDSGKFIQYNKPKIKFQSDMHILTCSVNGPSRTNPQHFQKEQWVNISL